MKKLLVLATLCLVSICCYAQSMGIRFYDRQGREFVVYAPSGQFSYSMFEGDNVTRNMNGWLLQHIDLKEEIVLIAQAKEY